MKLPAPDHDPIPRLPSPNHIRRRLEQLAGQQKKYEVLLELSEKFEAIDADHKHVYMVDRPQ